MSNQDERKRIQQCDKTRPFGKYLKSLKVALKDFVWLLALLFVAIMGMVGIAWIATYLQDERGVHDAPQIPEARGLASFDQGPIVEFELICPGNNEDEFTEIGEQGGEQDGEQVQDPVA